MNPYLYNLKKIARDLSVTNPVLAKKLDEQIKLAITNPGRQTIEDHVEKSISILKSIKSTLESTLKDYGDLDEENLKDFASAFDNAADAEIEALQNVLAKVQANHAASVAGPKDWLKGLFKNKKKNEEPSGMEPSYRMKESDIDDFVEGKSEWDSAKMISDEAKSNRNFFSGVSDVIAMFKKLVEKPTKAAIDTMIKAIDKLISTGKSMLKQEKKVEPKKTPAPPKPKSDTSIKTPDFENKVNHYVDMLKENIDNPVKVKKYLKEFFDTMKADVEDERVSFAARKVATARVVRLAAKFPSLKSELSKTVRVLNGVTTGTL